MNTRLVECVGGPMDGEEHEELTVLPSLSFEFERRADNALSPFSLNGQSVPLTTKAGIVTGRYARSADEFGRTIFLWMGYE